MKALLVEDDENDAALLRGLFKRQAGIDIELDHVTSLEAAVNRLAIDVPEIVLLDLNLPDSSGLNSAQAIQNANPDVPIVVLSGHDDEDFAIEILNHGVQDYLVKWEGNARTILRAIRYAIERKRSEQHLNYLAHFDRLTGLANRQHFHDQIEKAIARAKRAKRRLALFFIDLDNFKIVNDTLGHDAGDKVLVSAGKKLEQCTRAGDMIARLGGDEFAVLVEDVGELRDAEAIGYNLLHALSDLTEVDGRPISVTASVGIAIFPTDNCNVGALLKNADIAMYQAKENGRNGLRFFTEEMHSELLNYHRTENDIRKAIDLQQFHLEFQPKIDLESHELCGLEALLRWNHPVRGRIAPMDFIPIAESSGHIVPLGYWIIEQACKHLQAWQQLGIAVPQISVNVSAPQFQQPDFHRKVRAILEQTGATPELLEFELTEGLLMEDTDSAQGCLQRLKSIGLRLAIDDFGTGHSCLSYLRRFPIDVLKIDKSFVSDIGKSSDGEAICAAIISMAQNLNLETVAEGIETQEQLAFLHGHGCNIGQGFLFSKPVRADQLQDLFPGAIHSDSIKSIGDTTRIRLLEGVCK